MAMEMKINLNLKMSQKLVMTPMLQQAIKLLPLARLELAQLVRQEIIENPVLEELLEEENEQDSNQYESGPKEDINPKAEQDATPQDQEIDWDSYFQDNIDRGMSIESYAEKPSIEATYKIEATLADHLMWQLDMTVDSETDKFIGSCIIGNIQNDGYLCADLQEIVTISQSDEENVLRVLKFIQGFEPTGAASRSLKECLMLQAQALSDKNPYVEVLIEH